MLASRPGLHCGHPAYRSRPLPPLRPSLPCVAVVDNEFDGNTFYTEDGTAVPGASLIPGAVSNGMSGEIGVCGEQ